MDVINANGTSSLSSRPNAQRSTESESAVSVSTAATSSTISSSSVSLSSSPTSSSSSEVVSMEVGSSEEESLSSSPPSGTSSSRDQLNQSPVADGAILNLPIPRQRNEESGSSIPARQNVSSSRGSAGYGNQSAATMEEEETSVDNTQRSSVEGSAQYGII